MFRSTANAPTGERCSTFWRGTRCRVAPERRSPLPILAWAKAAIGQDRVFRSVNKGGSVSGDGMSAQAVIDVVRQYAEVCGFEGLAAHDLRRTFAKLAHKGGAKLDQIQLSLGHASIKTTERYLGVEQDLQDAPCDRLGLRLRG